MEKPLSDFLSPQDIKLAKKAVKDEELGEADLEDMLKPGGQKLFNNFNYDIFITMPYPSYDVIYLNSGQPPKDTIKTIIDSYWQDELEERRMEAYKRFL